MFEDSQDNYSAWRSSPSAASALREGAVPAEVLLQSIWHHQRLLRDELFTVDGRKVRVLHPGFWNREAGPDFRDAVIQVGTDAPQSGDVEIDLEPSNWKSHGHAGNPNFAKVILHVVWDGAASSAVSPHPLLGLSNVLDAPLAALQTTLSGDTGGDLPEALKGRCLAPLKELSAERVSALLEEAALCRLRMKASQFEARARQAGWEQALWEGMFRALGYKNNSWPMQRIGELLPSLGLVGEGGRNAVACQARLLGVSGLLPDDSGPEKTPVAESYARRVWDHWWRERDSFAEHVLPKNIWKMSGQRPANHPLRRLALASHWLAGGELIARLENWFATPVEDSKLAPSLLKLLQVGADEFWGNHWTLHSSTMAKPQPLLGETRASDIAVNVILPWLWTRSHMGENEALRKVAETRFFAWPRAQDNAVLKLARQRLLGGSHSKLLKTAARQQGLMQIVRDFCARSNSLCEDCRFPDLAKARSV